MSRRAVRVPQELQSPGGASGGGGGGGGAQGGAVVHMPTREQLQQAGHHDLIRYINDAGGFLEVPLAHSQQPLYPAVRTLLDNSLLAISMVFESPV